MLTERELKGRLATLHGYNAVYYGGRSSGAISHAWTDAITSHYATRLAVSAPSATRRQRSLIHEATRVAVAEGGVAVFSLPGETAQYVYRASLHARAGSSEAGDGDVFFVERVVDGREYLVEEKEDGALTVYGTREDGLLDGDNVFNLDVIGSARGAICEIETPLSHRSELRPLLADADSVYEGMSEQISRARLSRDLLLIQNLPGGLAAGQARQSKTDSGIPAITTDRASTELSLEQTAEVTIDASKEFFETIARQVSAITGVPADVLLGTATASSAGSEPPIFTATVESMRQNMSQFFDSVLEGVDWSFRNAINSGILPAIADGVSKLAQTNIRIAPSELARILGVSEDAVSQGVDSSRTERVINEKEASNG